MVTMSKRRLPECTNPVNRYRQSSPAADSRAHAVPSRVAPEVAGPSRLAADLQLQRNRVKRTSTKATQIAMLNSN
jgi:hypothetical protein